jgi:hypothetical protein
MLRAFYAPRVHVAENSRNDLPEELGEIRQNLKTGCSSSLLPILHGKPVGEFYDWGTRQA